MYIPFNYQNWRGAEWSDYKAGSDENLKAILQKRHQQVVFDEKPKQAVSSSALEEAEDWLLGDKSHFETRILSEIDRTRAAKRRSALKHKKAEQRKKSGRDKRADYPVSQFIGRWVKEVNL